MTDHQLTAEPAGRVVGLDGCAGGWFAVWSDGAGEGFKSELYADLSAVFADHSEADRLLADIPIGLESASARACDSLVRRQLGARGSSVFSAPCRAVVEYYQREGDAASYERASEIQREQRDGGISRQSWNITPKIAAMDEYLREESPAVAVVESHPERCFAALNDGYPVAQPKSSAQGRAARFGVLGGWSGGWDGGRAGGWRSCYEAALNDYYRNAVARDDIIDALVLAVAGRQSLESVPAEPPTDERGLPMQIVAPAVEPSWTQYTDVAEQ